MNKRINKKTIEAVKKMAEKQKKALFFIANPQACRVEGSLGYLEHAKARAMRWAELYHKTFNRPYQMLVIDRDLNILAEYQ